MENKRLIIPFIIALLIGGLFGYIAGYNQGISDCVDIGVLLLKTNNIDININPELIKYALLIYQAKVRQIIKNYAPLYNNTRP